MASILVPLAEGFEELEAITITDLFTRAGAEVVTAGLQAGPVKAARNTTVQPLTTIDQVGDRLFDLIVLPGGQPGSNNLNADERIHTLLKSHANAGKYIAAICAAPLVLAHAGLLNHRRATSFPGALEGIPVEGLSYVEDAVVVDGKLITSRGPGTAMDFSLCLIELVLGEQVRRNVEMPLQRPI